MLLAECNEHYRPTKVAMRWVITNMLVVEEGEEGRWKLMPVATKTETEAKLLCPRSDCL